MLSSLIAGAGGTEMVEPAEVAAFLDESVDGLAPIARRVALAIPSDTNSFLRLEESLLFLVSLCRGRSERVIQALSCLVLPVSKGTQGGFEDFLLVLTELDDAWRRFSTRCQSGSDFAFACSQVSASRLSNLSGDGLFASEGRALHVTLRWSTEIAAEIFEPN